jgi:hypothetical protein
LITVFNASLSASLFCNAAGTRFFTDLSNVNGTQAIDHSTQDHALLTKFAFALGLLGSKNHLVETCHGFTVLFIIV